ncbi:MAG: ABC transporter substrate-binding protein [Rhizomicrobium sp.]
MGWAAIRSATLGLAGAALLFSPQGEANAKPQRIMSLKICTDELLMDLVPPSRIASITYLSREKAALKLWPEAAHIPVNHNSPEEVLKVRPDLILTDNFTPPTMRSLLLKSGAPLLEVSVAENFAEIPGALRRVGRAVGEEARAEALIADMFAKIRQLQASEPKLRIRVVSWGGGGYVPGREGLFNAVLELAGGIDIARTDSYYDVESLIAARPQIIAYGDDYLDSPSLRQDQNDHPVLLKFFKNRRVVYPAAAAYNCGLPQSVDAAQALRAAMLAAMAKPGGVK